MTRHRTWARPIREAAERLAAEDGLALSDVVARLKTDHGVDVPRATVGGWLQRTRRSSVHRDLSAAIGGLAGRAVGLADDEMTALERHGRRPIDLERLAKLVSLLRSIEGLKSAAPKVKARARQLAELGDERGLEDLGDPLSEAQNGERTEVRLPTASLLGEDLS